jgi:hypothetical protein
MQQNFHRHLQPAYYTNVNTTMKQLSGLRYYAHFPALISLISAQRTLTPFTALRYRSKGDVVAA